MVQEILKILKNHGIIAFPTETVMGLGVLFDDFEAYNNLNAAKRRPEDKPYTMMLGNVKDIEKYAIIDKNAQKLIEKFMPGPITLLLKSKNSVPNYVTHNSGVVGVRVPGMKDLCKLLNAIGTPLLVPSANRSSEKPALNSEEVKNIFGHEVGYVVEGSANGEKPSTIIDLTGNEYKIVREGPISQEEIIMALKD